MYAWSIFTRLHGSTSLGPECKVVCEKFPYSLHFLHLFIYCSTSRKYPGHHACNFILFCAVTNPQCISSCKLFITNFLGVSGGIIGSLLQITPCSIVNLSYFFEGSFRPRAISPYVFIILDVILHCTRSCLVSAAILSKDKTSVSNQYKNVSSNSSLLSFDSLTVNLRVEWHFFWHIRYQSQMALILLAILVFSMSSLLGNFFLDWI